MRDMIWSICEKSLSDAGVFWTAVGAIAQGAASILGLGALIYSIRSFRSAERNMRDTEHSLRKSIRDSYYGEMDRMLFELLSLSCGKSHLIDPRHLPTRDSSSEEFHREYEHYAWMVWNFVETIFDRIQGDETLEETWMPAVLSLNAAHREWFDRDSEMHPSVRKFKDSFVTFVRTTLPRHEDVRRHLRSHVPNTATLPLQGETVSISLTDS